MGSNCKLEVEMKNGVKLVNVLGGLPVERKGKKCVIKVGDLKYE